MSTLLSALPLLLVLACPLMMIVMMRGMGGHSMHQASPPGNAPARSEDPAITARIAELERELAAVRTKRDDRHPPASSGPAT